MRRPIVVGVVVVAVVAIVAVFLIARRDSERSTPETTSTAGSAASGSARDRDPTIPVGNIIRDAKRRVPDDGRPTRDPVVDMVMPPEWRPSPQTVETLRTMVPPAVIEGAIPSNHLVDYSGLLQWYQAGAHEISVRRFDACRDEFLARGGILERDFDVMIALRLVADGRHARVVDVISPPESWPDALDDESRECFLRMYAALNWPAKEIVDVTFEWPLSIGPSQPTTTTPR